MLYQHPVLEQHEGYLGMDLVILNYDQMTRTTPDLAPPLQTSARHQREDVWPPQLSFSVQQAPYTTDLQWNRVWYLRPSGPEVETLPQGHRSLSSQFKVLFYSVEN
ncbi:hypothetical protein AVEN_101418-1 [Araneus ventricosus]|uniref:Uncharacterized protein n=1 Tax=Araneus ventricosus TaxID=182803 RepID=A0A4Y2CV77_ARAVE|nr:hypothetical protein AVEN_101418-1 [Araneus ventricosus]